MLSRMLLLAAVERREGEVIPRLLDSRDHAWLELLMDAYVRHVDRLRTELDEHLSEAPLSRAPRIKLRLATHVFDRFTRARTAAAVAAREARALVFRARAASAGDRADVLDGAAKCIALTPGELEALLFCDLPSQRRIAELPFDGPEAAAGAVNATLIAALLARASSVRISLAEGGELLARYARNAGLICLGQRGPDGGLTLEISGPFSLFRRSELYGRALASLLPRLAEHETFELRASVALADPRDALLLTVRSSDPLGLGTLAGRPPRSPVSRLRQDLNRAATQWTIADAAPIRSEDMLLFPDLELRSSVAPDRSWLVVCSGFWTPESLESDLARFARAGRERVVFCVDVRRGCGDGEPPEHPRIIRHRGRVDVRELLALLHSE